MKKDYLQKSDCKLPSAKEFPGKWYRTNTTGSLQFKTKADWVRQEIRKWYYHMKDHPKYDQTALFRKAWCLQHHLRYLKVAISEARQQLEEIEHEPLLY